LNCKLKDVKICPERCREVETAFQVKGMEKSVVKTMDIAETQKRVREISKILRLVLYLMIR
jgi:hypothetical protein